MVHCSGVDVSVFQGLISWPQVKASGYSFAIAKATQGANYTDADFARNRDEARAAGLIFGAYHYMNWPTDPIAQAKYFLSVYQPKNGDLPPALDCEAFTLSPADTTAAIAAFLEVVEPHLGGSKMLLYMNWAAINEQSIVTDDFAGHPLWLAEYGPPTFDVPKTWRAPTIWQYTDTLQVGGIDGNVDGDLFLGTIEDIQALTLKGIPA